MHWTARICFENERSVLCDLSLLFSNKFVYYISEELFTFESKLKLLSQCMIFNKKNAPEYRTKTENVDQYLRLVVRA